MLPSSAPKPQPPWGEPPWTIDFHPPAGEFPQEADFVIVGGGFSGLSAAAWLRRFDPQKAVVLLESGHIGAGSSGHTGGTVLAESASGDLPGLGDVLAGYSSILRELGVSADLHLPGAWELGRTGGLPHSPISWQDSGTLRAVAEVPGGTVDPGKVLSGLAKAAELSGAQIFENVAAEEMALVQGDAGPLRVDFAGGRRIRAGRVLFASNAQSLELSGMESQATPKLTLALATEPLAPAQIEALGLAEGKPFYTVDFPYLWGRTLPNGGVIFGSGLVDVQNWRDLAQIEVAAGEAARIMARLEDRVHALHPALRGVGITHRWGGPILIGEDWTPVFRQHPRTDRAIVLGAYSGHGVALSVYLGRWAAEALLGRRAVPNWNTA